MYRTILFWIFQAPLRYSDPEEDGPIARMMCKFLKNYGNDWMDDTIMYINICI